MTYPNDLAVILRKLLTKILTKIKLLTKVVSYERLVALIKNKMIKKKHSRKNTISARGSLKGTYRSIIPVAVMYAR